MDLPGEAGTLLEHRVEAGPEPAVPRPVQRLLAAYCSHAVLVAPSPGGQHLPALRFQREDCDARVSATDVGRHLGVIAAHEP